VYLLVRIIFGKSRNLQNEIIGEARWQRKKAGFKYQSWYLTPCCGLEVQKLTQTLKSFKGPGNTFD
jgi:hypothetical protein